MYKVNRGKEINRFKSHNIGELSPVGNVCIRNMVNNTYTFIVPWFFNEGFDGAAERGPTECIEVNKINDKIYLVGYYVRSVGGGISFTERKIFEGQPLIRIDYSWVRRKYHDLINENMYFMVTLDMKDTEFASKIDSFFKKGWKRFDGINFPKHSIFRKEN